MKTYTCKSCNSNFESKKGCKNRTPKYCSKQCYSESLKLNCTCKLCGNTIDGKGSSVKNRVYCSNECKINAKRNIQLSESHKLKISLKRKSSDKCKGSNLYNWKGGQETLNIRMRGHFLKRKKGLEKEVPILFLERLILNQKNKCFYCESDLLEYKALEHLTPISRGGDNDVYNLVYSCKSCNSKKRQNTLEEYAIKTENFHWLDKWDYLFANSL